MGRSRVHFVFCLRSRGIESHSVRCPGRRIGNCRRTHDRIFGLQVCHVFHGGIHWNVRHKRLGCDPVSRRLAGADCSVVVHSVLCLVFRQAWGAAFRLYLDSRNPAARSRRSDHELRLEIHVADGVHVHRRRRRVALRGAWPGRMALVAGSSHSCLYRAFAVDRYAKEIRRSHLSFRRMNNVAFVVISILTLAAALAAASLPKLIHAALSFAVTFVGIAAFFFLLGAEFVGLIQVFVYVGAVAVLIVFTILLTRRDAATPDKFKWGGVVVAVALFGGLVWAIL